MNSGWLVGCHGSGLVEEREEMAGIKSTSEGESDAFKFNVASPRL